MVWGGHVSMTAIVCALIVHAAALIWLLGDPARLRLITYDFQEVPSEASLIEPPQALVPLGYTEDRPEDLAAIRALAAPVVAGVTDDGDRVRRLGEFIYALHDPRMASQTAKDSHAASDLLGLDPDDPDCGQIAGAMAMIWRSLDGHTRGVLWSDLHGGIGHDAVELYSPLYSRWIYYDPNLNGFGVDDDGIPLSIAALRSNLLTGEDVHLVGGARHEWTAAQFTEALRHYPGESYALNNRRLYWQPRQRFGRFASYSGALLRLPWPVPRMVDNVAGNRDRRLVVTGRMQVAGLFTLTGARRVTAYLLIAIAFLLATLWRGARSSSR
jgi:hypothetical protein